LIGIGGQPNIELAEAAGLAIDNGIMVDALCRTSAPDVFAAGDCTSFPSGRYGRRLRLESVQNAVDQAKAAALAMIDKGVPYDPVPWFWSDQYETKFQIAGLGQGADRHVVRGDPESGRFAVGHLLDGRLIALDAINRPRDYMMARRLVPTAAKIDVARFEDPDISLDETIG
jgi:3-phenylpropionate/trans-cinnamate dioxygenase ferredoxin reductase subunit